MPVLCTWLLAAATGLLGLALTYGFDQPIIRDAAQIARFAMLACAVLFALSRVMMLLPLSKAGGRLRRSWLDYLLLLAAAIWWRVQPERQAAVLSLVAGYTILFYAIYMARSGVRSLAEGLTRRGLLPTGAKVAAAALVLVLIGGSVLALPVCWRGGQPVAPDHPLAGYLMKLHWLDCTFTAAAALTGTGLAVQDLGDDYSPFGQCVILVLMQIGCLAVLAIATAAGLRLRQWMRWASVDDDFSPAGVRRAIRFVGVSALLIEAAGAVAIYPTWDADTDLNFRTATQQLPCTAWIAEHGGPAVSAATEARVLYSAFHAVSAFGNIGLTLTRNSMMDYRDHGTLLSALFGLMLLGGLTGPVLYELLRRTLRRGGMGWRQCSRDVNMTLTGTALLMGLGTALLVGVESTRDWQQRYPREQTPGRIHLDSQPGESGQVHRGSEGQGGRRMITFSAQSSTQAQAGRLQNIEPPRRWWLALWQIESARSGGFTTLRLDEPSLSPASHLLLCAWILIGGSIGGTAGGVPIVLIVLALAGIVTAGRHRAVASAIDIPPPARTQAITLAAALALATLLLTGLVTFVLVYRETGTPLACAFEAVSACGNAGLSMGLTPQLSLQGRVTITLAMIAGRLLSLLFLLRLVGPAAEAATAQSHSTSSIKAPIIKDTVDLPPIPLE